MRYPHDLNRSLPGNLRSWLLVLIYPPALDLSHTLSHPEKKVCFAAVSSFFNIVRLVHIRFFFFDFKYLFIVGNLSEGLP